jgi:hypothetical protein
LTSAAWHICFEVTKPPTLVTGLSCIACYQDKTLSITACKCSALMLTDSNIAIRQHTSTVLLDCCLHNVVCLINTGSHHISSLCIAHLLGLLTPCLLLLLPLLVPFVGLPAPQCCSASDPVSSTPTGRTPPNAAAETMWMPCIDVCIPTRARTRL